MEQPAWIVSATEMIMKIEMCCLSQNKYVQLEHVRTRKGNPHDSLQCTLFCSMICAIQRANVVFAATTRLFPNSTVYQLIPCCTFSQFFCHYNQTMWFIKLKKIKSLTNLLYVKLLVTQTSTAQKETNQHFCKNHAPGYALALSTLTNFKPTCQQ